jgi:GTPase
VGFLDHNGSMTFEDEATIWVRAGRGGDGSSSIRREPYTPNGGPDGGNGGPGGSVVLEVDAGVRDLTWLRDHPHQAAEGGGSGGRSKRDGRTGADQVLSVPDGTVVRDDRGLLADLVGNGARAVVAKGGRGGRGNASRSRGRNRAARPAEAGEPGEERRLQLELRTVADVGLIGLPNAGKSTLLAAISAARPKVADYPFTTLTPNLGVAESSEGRFVVADIPGLVEGAHEGRGLGDRFLRHITRCRALVWVVDLSSADPASDLATVRAEVKAYDADLAGRPSIVVGTKSDLVEDAASRAAELAGAQPHAGDSPSALAVSALTGAGMAELAERLASVARRAEQAGEQRRPYVVLRPARAPFVVRREGERYRVVGRGVESLVAETDFDDNAQVVRLQKALVRQGVERELAEAGARRGDEIVIGDRAFEFFPEEQASG